MTGWAALGIALVTVVVAFGAVLALGALSVVVLDHVSRPRRPTNHPPAHPGPGGRPDTGTQRKEPTT